MKKYLVIGATFVLLLVPILFKPVLLAPSNAKSTTTSQQAAAIIFSACTYGTPNLSPPKGVNMNAVDFYKIGVEGTVTLVLLNKLYTDGAVQGKSSDDVTTNGRIGMENALQGFNIGSTLDSKWLNLSKAFNGAIQKGVDEFNSGKTIGASGMSAIGIYGAQLKAGCMVARSMVLSDSKKAKMSVLKWVIYAGGDLLPKLNPVSGVR